MPEALGHYPLCLGGGEVGAVVMEDAEGRQCMGTGGLGYLPAHLGHTHRQRKVPARISRPDPPFSRASLPAPGPAGSAVTG